MKKKFTCDGQQFQQYQQNEQLHVTLTHCNAGNHLQPDRHEMSRD